MAGNLQDLYKSGNSSSVRSIVKKLFSALETISEFGIYDDPNLDVPFEQRIDRRLPAEHYLTPMNEITRGKIQDALEAARQSPEFMKMAGMKAVYDDPVDIPLYRRPGDKYSVPSKITGWDTGLRYEPEGVPSVDEEILRMFADSANRVWPEDIATFPPGGKNPEPRRELRLKPLGMYLPDPYKEVFGRYGRKKP